jgi:hypothetical protein
VFRQTVEVACAAVIRPGFSWTPWSKLPLLPCRAILMLFQASCFRPLVLRDQAEGRNPGDLFHFLWRTPSVV